MDGNPSDISFSGTKYVPPDKTNYGPIIFGAIHDTPNQSYS